MNNENVLIRSLENFVGSFREVAINNCTAATSLAQAEDILYYLKMSESERRAYERHLDNVNYEIDALDTARKEGIEEGRKEGIEEGRKATTLQVAKNMLEQGVDISIITAVTGLSEAEVGSL